MSSNTQVLSEVDLQAEGLHTGYLQIPHSVHRSAYGWIPLPIVSIRNGTGPVILLLGGNHGDEYEGQVVLSKLCRELDPATINGQLIILPMANYPAARAGLRTSPIDDGNLNRSFPGNPQGTPTQMIAHYIESELIARADLLLDIHSGGSSMRYQPTAMMSRYEDAVDYQRGLSLLRSLGFARAILHAENTTGSYSSSAARRHGIIGMTLEMAGGGNVDNAAVDLLEAGLVRFFCEAGLTDCTKENMSAADTTQLFSIESDQCYVYAHHEGVFQASALIGDAVTAGQLAGWIHQTDQPWLPPHKVLFRMDAVVTCTRVPARVERGDCLYETAVPIAD